LGFISITVGNSPTKHLQAFVDTGAPIAYIHHDFIPVLTPTGNKKQDFSPLLGQQKWETDIYSTPMILGSPGSELKLNHEFGILPTTYENMFFGFGPQAVIGQDLIKAFEFIGFDFEGSRLVFGPRL